MYQVMKTTIQANRRKQIFDTESQAVAYLLRCGFMGPVGVRVYYALRDGVRVEMQIYYNSVRQGWELRWL